MKKILSIFLLFIFFVSCTTSPNDEEINNTFPEELWGVWVNTYEYVEGLKESLYPIYSRDYFLIITEKEISVTRQMVFTPVMLNNSSVSMQLLSMHGDSVELYPNRDEVKAPRYNFSYKLDGDTLSINNHGVLFLFDSYKRISKTLDEIGNITLPDELIGVWDFDSYHKDNSYDPNFVNPTYVMTITQNEIVVSNLNYIYDELSLIPTYYDGSELRLVKKDSVGLSTGNYGFSYTISGSKMYMDRTDPYGTVIFYGSDADWTKR